MKERFLALPRRILFQDLSFNIKYIRVSQVNETLLSGPFKKGFSRQICVERCPCKIWCTKAQICFVQINFHKNVEGISPSFDVSDENGSFDYTCLAWVRYGTNYWMDREERNVLPEEEGLSVCLAHSHPTSVLVSSEHCTYERIYGIVELDPTLAWPEREGPFRKDVSRAFGRRKNRAWTQIDSGRLDSNL